MKNHSASRATAAARVEPLEPRDLLSAVAARHVFYNNSAYDGKSINADPRDDAAVATDKAALLPGQTASYANVTNVERGINGVMVDVQGLPAGVTLTADDFAFKAGDTADPSAWAAAPSPTRINVRRGAGDGGSDRVTITFADFAISHEWLQVTVLANADTGLASPDVFYFGNLPGDAGGNVVAPVVNAIDLADTRRNINRLSPVNGPADHNRDGRVNALDLAIVRKNLNRGLIQLAAPTLGGGTIDVYVDVNHDGTFQAGELVTAEEVNLGDVPQGGEGVLVRLVNSGSAPVVLDGSFTLEEQPDRPFGPGFSIRLAPGAPANVTIVETEVDRTLPDGTVLHDRVVTFMSPTDSTQPKVLQPGETIDLQISGNVIGTAAGSGAPTRRGKRIRFTGRVVTG